MELTLTSSSIKNTDILHYVLIKNCMKVKLYVLQVNNGNKEIQGLFPSVSFRFFFSCPRGGVSLTKPIATLKCSPQLLNQRRCLNQ